MNAFFLQFLESGPPTGGAWTATRRVSDGTDNQTTPEPSTIVGLALAVGLGISLRKRNQANQ